MERRKANKETFRHTEIEMIYHQEPLTTRTVKGPPLSRRKTMSDGNLNPHKRMKSTGNDKYMGNGRERDRSAKDN